MVRIGPLFTSVRAATTANITLSATQTVDGVALVAGDRVLVKDQSTASANGIYVVAAGAWVRATDADSATKVTGGMFNFVEEGTANADSGWVTAGSSKFWPTAVGTVSKTTERADLKTVRSPPCEGGFFANEDRTIFIGLRL